MTIMRRFSSSSRYNIEGVNVCKLPQPQNSNRKFLITRVQISPPQSTPHRTYIPSETTNNLCYPSIHLGLTKAFGNEQYGCQLVVEMGMEVFGGIANGKWQLTLPRIWVRVRVRVLELVTDNGVVKEGRSLTFACMETNKAICFCVQKGQAYLLPKTCLYANVVMRVNLNRVLCSNTSHKRPRCYTLSSS